MDDNNVAAGAVAITKAQLNAVGINLPDDEMEDLIQRAENEVNERVGEELFESLDDDQLKEFVAMQEDESVSDDKIAEWLAERVPDYKQIVDDNTVIVLDEVVKTILNNEAETAQKQAA